MGEVFLSLFVICLQLLWLLQELLAGILKLAPDKEAASHPLVESRDMVDGLSDFLVGVGVVSGVMIIVGVGVAVSFSSCSTDFLSSRFC